MTVLTRHGLDRAAFLVVDSAAPSGPCRVSRELGNRKGVSVSYLIGNQHAKGNRPNATSFTPGMIPWNKGKRGYMPANRTSFQPGPRPELQAPLGTIVTRTRHKRGAKQRKFIKTETGWIEFAKHVWISAAQMLLPGDIVHHINGDSVDDRFENLIAIPRNVHPTIHSRWGLKAVPTSVWQQCGERYGLSLGPMFEPPKP